MGSDTIALDPRQLPIPIIQAPMAGGPSTPALAGAVSGAGGLGFLAAGYKTTDALATDIQAVRQLTPRPFGVNIFCPPLREARPAIVRAYASTLAADAERYGVQVGERRFDDDGFDAKLELALDERVDVVSFTFGCPDAPVVQRLHARGIAAWVTVTSPGEARAADAAGADALVAQGTEAGGHRAYFDDDAEHEEYGLLVLLRLLAARTSLPLIATGGIADGAAIAAVLCAGAAAAQLGSAFMLTPEAGTSAAHRDRLASDSATRLTRAFSGRRARGIVNRFMVDHDDQAPRAYPEVHHLTTPIRAAARRAGDPDAINLWAGQGHSLAPAIPAAEFVSRLADEAVAALRGLDARLAGRP